MYYVSHLLSCYWIQLYHCWIVSDVEIKREPTFKSQEILMFVDKKTPNNTVVPRSSLGLQPFALTRTITTVELCGATVLFSFSLETNIKVSRSIGALLSWHYIKASALNLTKSEIAAVSHFRRVRSYIWSFLQGTHSF